jgi:hypothetical protein
MNWREQVPAFVWLGVGSAIAIGAYNLGIGAVNNPGPGLFPFVIGLGMVLLSASIIAASIGTAAAPTTGPTPRQTLTTLAVIGALVFYALALERIGFVLCTILFLFGLLTVLGRYGWLVAATASVGMTAGSYLIFTTLLKLHLPSGPLGL